MSLPIEELTPRQIVAQLDRYIVGQDAAKRAVAVALRNRYRRLKLPAQDRDDIIPKNILMIGPTGVGKTEIARRLAQLARAPFIKVEATKFTEVGYVGRDVESMIRDLANAAVRLVERERTDAVLPEAENQALERLVDLVEDLVPRPERKRREVGPDAEGAQTALVQQTFGVFGHTFEVPNEGYEFEEEDEAERDARRAKLRREIEAGDHDELMVEFYVEEAQNQFLQVFTPQGMEEMGLDMANFGGAHSRHSSKRMSVADARPFLVDQEARKLLDTHSLNREAISRAEQTGIIFLDEIDKVAGKSGGSGPDVSREGVQRDLLPVIEGSTVATKYGPLRTDHILFIAAGAFHISKPSDLIPELQGRLPIRVELENLTETDFRRILNEPQNALTKQYEKLLAVEGVKVEFTADALDEIAHFALQVNQTMENIGARRLHTVLEKLLEDILYQAPEIEAKHIVYDGARVRERLQGLGDPTTANTLI
ncbi:MAG: ATP-dependent protease ATPase subunit HslU [Fimbriimonadaceae bacterium]|nr:ATP-dependent protease ATPase subunit HslU [Fimbriimonadaceae bacterium]